jgi:hypothetical protein
MAQVIKATVAKFHDEFINGTAGKFDTSGTPGFDGIEKAVASTVTDQAGTVDWSGIGDDRGKANDALDELDAWMDSFDGMPSVLISGDKGIARLRSLARRAGYYDRTKNDFGVEVESYRGVPFLNLREKDGSADPIVAASNATSSVEGKTSIYGVRFGLDGVHAVSTPGQLVKTWLPDFSTSGAVKKGEVEMGPVAPVVKRTRSAGAFRAIIAPKTGA